MKSRKRESYTPANDYYTPKWVFDGLGLKFDLDVCAPEGGTGLVPADKHYSLKDDGLISPWFGRVWMNPPYSEPKPWIEKFIEHNNGIALVAISRSRSFKALWDKADGMVIFTTDLSFITPEGKLKGIFMPVALMALGAENVAALHRMDKGRVR